MKDQICRAFCEAVDVRHVPCGMAVTMPFALSDGDPIVVYVINDGGTHWRVEDDGTSAPALEAAGVRITTGARGEVFDDLLREYSAAYDVDAQTVAIAGLTDDDVPAAILKLSLLLLRLQDLLLLRPERVRDTFKEDAVAAIHRAFDSRATVIERAPIVDVLPHYVADVVLQTPSAPPLAIYLATTDHKGLEALVVKMEAEKYQEVSCKVFLLVEYALKNPLREATYALAQARLDGTLTFRGAWEDSMAVIGRALDAHPTVQ